MLLRQLWGIRLDLEAFLFFKESSLQRLEHTAIRSYQYNSVSRTKKKTINSCTNQIKDFVKCHQDRAVLRTFWDILVDRITLSQFVHTNHRDAHDLIVFVLFGPLLQRPKMLLSVVEDLDTNIIEVGRITRVNQQKILLVCYCYSIFPINKLNLILLFQHVLAKVLLKNVMNREHWIVEMTVW